MILATLIVMSTRIGSLMVMPADIGHLMVMSTDTGRLVVMVISVILADLRLYQLKLVILRLCQ
jgi:hypothetical protein